MRKESGKILFILSAFFTFVFLFSEATFAAEDSCSFPNSQGGGSAILNGKCYDHAPNLSVCEEGVAAAAISDCSGSKKCCATCTSDAEYDRTCADNCASEWTVSSSQVCSKKCCEKKKTSTDISKANTIYFDQNSYSVKSNQSSITVGVKRTAGEGAVSVNYKTYDDSARSGRDYESTSGAVSWESGDTSEKNVTISIKNGFAGGTELRRTFFVKLENPSGTGVSVPHPLVTVVIDNSRLETATECVNAKNPDGSTKGYSCEAPSGCKEFAPGDDANLKCHADSLKCCKVWKPYVPSTFSPTSSNSVYTLFEQIPGTQGRNMQFPEYIAAIYKFLIWSIVFAAILMVMIGGFWYLTAAGNTSQVGTAKTIISDALLGLVVILFTWIILSVINPDLVSINLKSLSALKINIVSTSPTGGTTTPGGPTGSGEVPGGGTPEPQKPVGSLSPACDQYDSLFNQYGSSGGVDSCLLKAMASKESSCNPNARSGVGACGLMQIMPSTATSACGFGCETIQGSAEKSLECAVKVLKAKQSAINRIGKSYVGSQFSLSGQTVTNGNYTYDTGNDDLLAAYNGGEGGVQPSSSCSDAPKWQCAVAGENCSSSSWCGQTRPYVVKIQAMQKRCSNK